MTWRNGDGTTGFYIQKSEGGILLKLIFEINLKIYPRTKVKS
jgi:hypothetical protein